MLIRERMTFPVRTVKPLDSVLHAREMLAEARINQLPVIVDGEVVGIVTDRDLRDAFPSVLEEASPRKRRSAEAAAHATVESVMSSSPLTLGPDDTVENAAGLMRRERVGAVPIVEKGRLVGILTRSDVLDAYLALSEKVGAHRHAEAESAPARASEEIRRNW